MRKKTPEAKLLEELFPKLDTTMHLCEFCLLNTAMPCQSQEQSGNCQLKAAQGKMRALSKIEPEIETWLFGPFTDKRTLH